MPKRPISQCVPPCPRPPMCRMPQCAPVCRMPQCLPQCVPVCPVPMCTLRPPCPSAPKKVKVVLMKVQQPVLKVVQLPKTPPRRQPPCPPKQVHVEQRSSKVLTGRVFNKLGVGSPVKDWPKDFWAARRMIYEESEAPATPVKIAPPSSEDICKWAPN